jgi:exopolysaccharide production protein ExoY
MEDINSIYPNLPLSLPFSFAGKIRHSPLKRLFDIIFSIFALIAGLPLFFIIALSICLTSRGKIIYSHERIGRGARSFRCYKFRTMHRDADARLTKLLEQDPELLHEWELNRKLKRDPRVTKIGSFLRKTSLDELPQFWNVLKGDLSVVGPRPVVKAEVVHFYGAKAHKILSVRPGLTGIWQVSGRSDTSYENRVALDELYIDQRSIKLDCLLVLKTIPAMFLAKGAY